MPRTELASGRLSLDCVRCSCIFEHVTRTSAEALGRLAEDGLVSTLDRLGIRHVKAHDSSVDLVVQFADRDVALEIKTTAYATPERVRAMIEHHPPGPASLLLVADHITEAARHELNGAGWSWLDRRGHLYLCAPGVMIDREVEPLPRPGTGGRPGPISGAAGLTVAYSILVDPETPQPVRASAPALGFSPASISTSRSTLREAGLLERDGLPVVPELFWALADVWKPDRSWLVNAPEAGDMHTNVHDLDASGWCLSGTATALDWGAPVVAVDPILDVYVPGPVMVTIARREYHAAQNVADASASIAVAPTALVTSRRQPPGGKGGWPLAHPLAVALDLAQDRARGREILEDWTPPPGFHRVW